MTDERNPVTGNAHDSARWLWLAALATFAFFAISSGKLLLAAGMLMLGVFAFFNDPLNPTSLRVPKPSPAMVGSWVVGFIGVVAVLAAGALAWR